MADVRITFSTDRTAAAERLREALSATGYLVALSPIADVEELIDSEELGSAVLIWSRSLVLSAMRPGVLRRLRQQRRLIEVSPDGVGPDGGEGDSHVILISGWRGQPFHPGWQRLVSELKPPSGASKEASEVPSRPTQAEPPAAPQAVRTEAPRHDWRPRIAKLALALLAAIGLFSAGFATSTWLRVGASGPEEPTSAAMERDAKQAPLALDRAIPPERPMVTQSGPPTPSGPNPAEPAITETPQAAAPSTPALETSDTREALKAPRKAKKENETGLTKGKSPAGGETKRYSRKNSAVMRLFCQGSGRSTPQCRTFLRETRATRR